MEKTITPINKKEKLQGAPVNGVEENYNDKNKQISATLGEAITTTPHDPAKNGTDVEEKSPRANSDSPNANSPEVGSAPTAEVGATRTAVAGGAAGNDNRAAAPGSTATNDGDGDNEVSSKETPSTEQASLARGEEEEEEDEEEGALREGIVEQSPKGRFQRFEETMGRGAFKVVYKAFDSWEGCEVALEPWHDLFRAVFW